MSTIYVQPTRNKEGGFYGNVGEVADTAWPLAMQAITKATGAPTSSVRAFLDSVRAGISRMRCNGRCAASRSL
ncbi:hypothetical protein WK39_27860 [Burkholderia cepacia]|nr:hypothetical protein WK39_27860 [Burkholderia cepacia]KVS65706.1 hypothetical protein WK40_12170 [Burkholderia cepacia]KWO68110.1 hypothetical protein WT98_22975 [Burkholderia territorii]